MAGCEAVPQSMMMPDNAIPPPPTLYPITIPPGSVGQKATGNTSLHAGETKTASGLA
jgi:hypothetical protein